MDTYTLSITQGSTFSLSITASDVSGNPLDLTSYSVRGLLKFRYSDTGILADLNPTIVTPQSGIVSLSIPATGTALLPITKAVYDIEVYNSSGYVNKILKGYADINPEATY